MKHSPFTLGKSLFDSRHDILSKEMNNDESEDNDDAESDYGSIEDDDEEEEK